MEMSSNADKTAKQRALFSWRWLVLSAACITSIVILLLGHNARQHGRYLVLRQRVMRTIGAANTVREIDEARVRQLQAAGFRRIVLPSHVGKDVSVFESERFYSFFVFYSRFDCIVLEIRNSNGKSRVWWNESSGYGYQFLP